MVGSLNTQFLIQKKKNVDRAVYKEIVDLKKNFRPNEPNGNIQNISSNNSRIYTFLKHTWNILGHKIEFNKFKM